MNEKNSELRLKNFTKISRSLIYIVDIVLFWNTNKFIMEENIIRIKKKKKDLKSQRKYKFKIYWKKSGNFKTLKNLIPQRLSFRIYEIYEDQKHY